ncbi:hypothetical protein CWI38_0434p0040 [Hamiltosporidium tvaerminnensis]|uniref:Uncharacterized protein n=2 Tax=Hamiltosporidium TaxID=1176354 RepID=A0A4Q9LB86_9MICR|nr:hypothetical protein CWI37_0064p0030 [Hamiltosporidium tvaerminnensis]TBU07994.1 hypothetical protein CWI36_0197p0040 [Hamiltosporidium magnivora]TBU13428.1 hypothetical protein CWI38_0434p0040 [Hamiltosporidium tvaerminnensis]
MNVEAYIQSIVLKETSKQFPLTDEEDLRINPPLKQLKTKNITPLISEEGITLEEPTINKNEESDLEEETTVVKEVEEKA